jgi:YHS domain-containing protein/predicted RNase H-like HicB family nuclease
MFTIVYLRGSHGYVAFIEELPNLNSSGRTLAEARCTLYEVAAAVFDEERRGVEALIAGKEVLKESFVMELDDDDVATRRNTMMTKSRDPVCGMRVDPAQAAGSAVHAGERYYFCCPACLSRFQANPLKYLAEPAEAGCCGGGGGCEGNRS